MVDTTLSLLKAVAKRRGKTILEPIDLDLKEALFTSVLGPNGSSKTM